MNKEQTHKKITKLIHLYEKRISTCSEQHSVLERVATTEEEFGEVNSLFNEECLLGDFVEDLKSLLKDEDE